MLRYLRPAEWINAGKQVEQFCYLRAVFAFLISSFYCFSMHQPPEYQLIAYFCEKVMVFHLLNRPHRADDAYERFFL